MVEELRLATLCINYLNLPSFKAPYSEHAVFAGEYGFMDYAILYWIRHLEAGLRSSSSEQDELHEDLAESLEMLVEQHWNNPTANVDLIPNRTRDTLETFNRCQKYQQIQLAVYLTDKELKYFGDTRPEQSALDFADVIPAIRQLLEMAFQNDADRGAADDLELKYGIHRFRCPRFSCKYFTEGFSTPEEREKHVERHERPARCTDEHCRGSKIGFATKAQLERHLKENHPDTTTERCYEFPTEEEISESVRENLPEPEPQPEHDLPQSLLAAEPATAPAFLEATPKPTQPREAFKRQKTKQDYECVHCGKKFNKKYNWQSHLASHSGGQQYSCPYCNKTCARSGDLSRHMRLHDPSSSVTCGGILSNGQRWGCGTSFARADILQTHYKSKRGRRCIAERDSEEQAGPSNS